MGLWQRDSDMTPCLESYAAFVFDCDGVVLDSNRIKSNAFRVAALPWGETAATELVRYHVAHGGVSRYAKLAYFLTDIAPHFAEREDGPGFDEMLATYASEVGQGLMGCAISPGLHQLRKATPGVRWLIVSGGDQRELRDLFAARGLAELFDGGIFGSPDAKDAILDRERSRGNLPLPAVFFGDSLYDYAAATRAGLDFVFVSDWSEVEDWPRFTYEHRLVHIRQLADLLECGP